MPYRSAMRRAALIVASSSAILALAASATAAARFETGLGGGDYVSGTAAYRAQWLDHAVEARAEIVRLTVGWSSLVSTPPANPGDPADPAYHFQLLDAAVSDARNRGLEPLLTVVGAPSFAEGGGRPAAAPAGTWKPDPVAFAHFAQALATRYSGSFGGLPRVRYFQAWNEPNLSAYLNPQYKGKRSVAPQIYRRLLNSFYSAVKSVDSSNVVITGGTAPYGDPPGGDRTRPLAFLRNLLCLKGRHQLHRTNCPTKAKFDVLAHHPIDTAGDPTRSAVNPDDAATPDFKNVARILRAAERKHTTGTPGHHALWATEIWWSSNPPDRRHGVPLAKQARYIEQALYILWKQGAKVVINLSLRDPPNGKPIAAGLLFADGSPKPSFEAYRFPFVTERHGRTLRAWGRAPSAGPLVIERKAGGWKTVKTVSVRAGQVFTAKLPLRGRQRLRAVINGEHSLVWTQR